MHLNISKSEGNDIKMTKHHPEASMVVIDAEAIPEMPGQGRCQRQMLSVGGISRVPGQSREASDLMKLDTLFPHCLTAALP